MESKVRGINDNVDSQVCQEYCHVTCTKNIECWACCECLIYIGVKKSVNVAPGCAFRKYCICYEIPPAATVNISSLAN